jgi:imidazoleglycerol phosphate dehydratase HisB/histidinol-phosphate/aromatic aminotransferase/cobyric acid decarboxylase-like protein
MLSAAFPPLVPGGEGLEHPPAFPEALRKRMAEVYGVPVECLLPVRGAVHGLELVLRRVRLNGFDKVASPEPSADLMKLGLIYGIEVTDQPAAGVGALVIDAPYDIETAAPFDVAADRPDAMPVLVVDEQAAELLSTPSLAPIAALRDDMVVLRDLRIGYGLAGAPCGALITSAEQIKRYEAVLEPYALPTPLVRLAEAALSPSRAVAVEARLTQLRGEAERMAAALSSAAEAGSLRSTEDIDVVIEVDAVRLMSANPAATRAALARFCAPGAWAETEPGRFVVAIGSPDANDRTLAALGVPASETPRRRADVIRDTKETRITVAVDLDAQAPRKVQTGVGFYDHMLDQVAAHGGFSLTLACEGDLEIDAHHTIEDCALALGAALKQALGDRKGIARFGFVLPMDEAEAQVSIDLGGRPYIVFEGTFAGSHIGEWPTEMTPHVFRSLAESLGASIHLSVKGENDHHKTEACFKAFGRALRQAIRVEGDAVPSTKGVL